LAAAPRSGGDSRADYGRKAIRRGCAGRLAAVTLAEQLGEAQQLFLASKVAASAISGLNK